MADVHVHVMRLHGDESLVATISIPAETLSILTQVCLPTLAPKALVAKAATLHCQLTQSKYQQAALKDFGRNWAESFKDIPAT